MSVLMAREHLRVSIADTGHDLVAAGGAAGGHARRRTARTRSRIPTRPWPPPLRSGSSAPAPRSAIAQLAAPSSPHTSCTPVERAARMLDRVGERLLHDAVGGELRARRQRAAAADDGERHWQAGVAGALDELGSAEAGRGPASSTPSSVCISASAAAPVVRMRAAASSARRGSMREDARAAGLHDHDADVVRDDVVHLARDPPALVSDRQRASAS